MALHLHIHHHPDKHFLELLEKLFSHSHNKQILDLLKQILMTQQELAVQLAATTSTINAIANDVSVLVNAGSNVTPELEAAANEITNAVNNLRNAVPQAPQP